MDAREIATLAHGDLVAGRYLAARARLRAAGAGGRDELWNIWFWTLVSIDPWHEGWPLEAGEPQAPADSLATAEPDGLAIVEALAADAVAAGRMVIVMERHALPDSRWAGARLLPALRRAGATHLAFETSLQEPLDRVERERAVRADAAPYLFDPSRAALLRAALDAGLRLVAFDHPADPEALTDLLRHQDYAALNGLRERWMAENLRRLAAAEPDARLVAWTGGQHAWKRTPAYYSVPLFDSWARDATMAALLAEIAGTEPFCLGQAVARGAGAARRPGAVRGDHPWAVEHGLDAVLVHFRGARPGRPAWIDEDRRLVSLPAGGARLVQALPAGEGPDAVPADQLLVRTDQIEFALPPGDYVCRGIGDDDQPVWQRSARC